LPVVGQVTMTGIAEQHGRHATVPVVSSALGVAADIDEAIAPLISALWERGIATQWSCQGTPNCVPEQSAYITFTPDAFVRFLAAAGRVLLEPGNPFISAAGIAVQVGSLPPGVHITLPRVHMDCGAELAGDDWVVQITIRFPPEQIPALTAAVLTPALRETP
jgi:hypothetical protein